MLIFILVACSQKEQEQSQSGKREREEAPASGRGVPEVIAENLASKDHKESIYRRRGWISWIGAHPQYRSGSTRVSYYEENGDIFNRVVRLKKEADGWVETAAVLEGIPGAHIHDGGRIKIGPDGIKLIKVTLNETGRRF